MNEKIWKNFLFFFPNNNKSLDATNGIEEFFSLKPCDLICNPYSEI